MGIKRIILTKKSLNSAPLGVGWIRIDDKHVPGLKLHSGKAKKTIYLRRRINNMNRDFKICTWEPQVTPNQIRKLAIREAAKIVEGVDPSAQRRSDSLKSVTLDEAYQLFIRTRTSGKNAVKASTVEQWQLSWKTDLQIWADRPMVEIVADDVQELHKVRTKSSPSRANFAVRLLGQIFRTAMTVYEDKNRRPVITYDPTHRISVLKLQNKIPRRTGHIPAETLKDWFEAVGTVTNEAARDLLIFTIMTGLRRNEAAQLTWDRVDLDAGVYTIVENKVTRPVTLPLSDYLTDMLCRRKGKAGTRRYVFPAGHKSGYWKDWRSACKKVGDQCGVSFCPHDLRRSFLTYAESLDIPILVMKMLVNHALPKDDVTSGYVQMNVERMRGPHQRISDYILKCAGMIESANVVQLHQEKG